MLDGISDVPVGVCLDTAHAFEAGYDITSEAGLSETIDALDSTIGLNRVAVIHVNDSKTPFGSRVDRHEHIGKGQIGLDAFRRILTHPRLSAAPPHGRAGRAFILETPIDAPGDDRRNVRTVWDLAGIAPHQAPDAEDGFSMLRAPREPADRLKTAMPASKVASNKVSAKRPSEAAKKSKQTVKARIRKRG
jgi:hypothetical protein